MIGKCIRKGLLSLAAGALAVSTPAFGLLGISDVGVTSSVNSTTSYGSSLAASDQGAGGGAGVGEASSVGFFGLGTAFGVGRDDQPNVDTSPDGQPGVGSSMSVNGTAVGNGAGLSGPNGERVVVQSSQGVSEDANHGWLNAGVLADNGGETGGWTGFGLRYDR